jgi:hypothetical protein
MGLGLGIYSKKRNDKDHDTEHEKFRKACSMGDLDKIKDLLINHEECWKKISHWIRDPLESACQKGNIDVVKTIYKYSVGIIHDHEHIRNINNAISNANKELAVWLTSECKQYPSEGGLDAVDWYTLSIEKYAARHLFWKMSEFRHVKIFDCKTEQSYQKHIDTVTWLIKRFHIDDELIDSCLDESLFEYAFELGYVPKRRMKAHFKKYGFQKRIADEITKAGKSDGVIRALEIPDIALMIASYIY